MSPEIVRNEEYDQRVDAWAVGVLTYFMIAGTPPFNNDAGDRVELSRQIQNDEPVFPDEWFCDTTEEGIDFIKCCLVKKEQDRPQIEELLTHPWIKQLDELAPKNFIRPSTTKRLLAFKKVDVFQAGIVALISGLLTSEKELKRFGVMFKQIDANGDGVITYEEFKAGINKVMEEPGAEKDWKSHFDALDFSKKGMIDFHEFVAASQNLDDIITQENIDKVFDLIDKNNSGEVNLQQMKKMFSEKQGFNISTRTKAKQAKIQKRIVEIVSEGKDSITREDFSRRMLCLVNEKRR